MSESSYCKFCGKGLLWVTIKEGRRVPLDKASMSMRYVTDAAQDPMTANMRRTYVDHRDVCTRRGKEGDAEQQRGSDDGPKLFGD